MPASPLRRPCRRQRCPPTCCLRDRASVCSRKSSDLFGEGLMQSWSFLLIMRYLTHLLTIRQFLVGGQGLCQSCWIPSPSPQPCSGSQDRRNCECCRTVPSLIEQTGKGMDFLSEAGKGAEGGGVQNSGRTTGPCLVSQFWLPVPGPQNLPEAHTMCQPLPHLTSATLVLFFLESAGTGPEAIQIKPGKEFSSS